MPTMTSTAAMIHRSVALMVDRVPRTAHAYPSGGAASVAGWVRR